MSDELLPRARAWVQEVHPHARHLLRTEHWVVRSSCPGLGHGTGAARAG